MIRIGIDPGLKGAIAIINKDEIQVFNMPTMNIPWVRRSNYITMIDTLALIEILKSIESCKDIRINIEAVHSMPQQGVSSTWHFAGAFFSALSTMVNYFGWDGINMIYPAQWKKKYGLINMPKDTSRLFVLKIYPHLKPFLQRKKDIDKAEAILIANY